MNFGSSATAANALAGFGATVFRALAGDRFITLPRSDLSRLLFEAISSTCEVMFDEEIVGLREGRGSVSVLFRHAGERVFDLVVGADGLHSNVRRLVFGPQSTFEKPLGYMVAAFEVEGYRPRDEDVYVVHNEPGRMLGRATLRDDRTLFRSSLPPTGPFLRILRRKKRCCGGFRSGGWECAQVLERLDEAADLYFDRVSQIKMETWSRGRVALVGDAAFCVSLLAGQGSALAITSAYVLAGELSKSCGQHREAFQSYEASLRRFIVTKQKAAERFAAAFAPKTPLGVFLRNQVINACSIPVVAQFAFGREIRDTLRLSDYAWPAYERLSS